ncbi:hypothetical protein BD626DRAFT_501480 [Schizophyllum amplum]|uniref:Uncharacterized protein n=1 Tax=Schizophyllum amplum TaxID=97359 RepID=A0A550C9V6_9AGAR|nr:hypothetical protein BD626DRAFT_501480 [Auriculariopsis ampla]
MRRSPSSALVEKDSVNDDLKDVSEDVGTVGGVSLAESEGSTEAEDAPSVGVPESVEDAVVAESATVDAADAADTASVYVETQSADNAASVAVEEADAAGSTEDAADSATRAEAPIEEREGEGESEEASDEGEGKAEAGTPSEAGASGGSEPGVPADAADGCGMS